MGVIAVQVADVQVLAVFEAVLAVVVRVAEDDDGFFALLAGEIPRVADEGAADALALVFGQDADRAEGEDIHGLALLIQQPGAGVHDIAHQPAVQLGDEIVFGQEIGVGAHLVNQVMFQAAGEVEIPESKAGEGTRRGGSRRGVSGRRRRDIWFFLSGRFAQGAGSGGCVFQDVHEVVQGHGEEGDEERAEGEEDAWGVGELAVLEDLDGVEDLQAQVEQVEADNGGDEDEEESGEERAQGFRRLGTAGEEGRRKEKPMEKRTKKKGATTMAAVSRPVRILAGWLWDMLEDLRGDENEDMLRRNVGRGKIANVVDM